MIKDTEKLLKTTKNPRYLKALERDLKCYLAIKKLLEYEED